jgi:hypothetical protein
MECYDEEWLVIEEAPNYLVSNLGRVQNRRTGHILSPGMAGHGYREGKGYLNVCLIADDGRRLMRYVHILVAEAFHPGDHSGLEVNHANTFKTNNSAGNLEWTTRKKNMEHASQHGLMSNVGAKKVPVRIVETGEVFSSQHACARAIGGSQARIFLCLNGLARTHMGYTFEFVE